MRLPSPDDVSAILSSPFVTLYWPVLVGGLVMFGFLVKGWTKSMILLGIGTAALQAWRMGYL